MKKKKISGLILIAITIIGLYFWFSKPKETIVDLGNGWKSYNHSQNAFTVKIPSDAEVRIGRGGDKAEYLDFDFSEGPISGMVTWLGNAPWNEGLDTRTANKNHLEKFGYPVLGEEKVRIGRRGMESVRFSREFLIADNWVVVIFEKRAGKIKQGGDTRLSFEAEKLFIVSKGENKSYTIYLRPEYRIKEDIATPEHPHYTQEEIEGFIEEYINQIEDLIISIDNF